jgi:hypothetical protein
VLARLSPDADDNLTPGAAGWLSLKIAPERSEDVNRALADAGIYAAELQIDTDLEELFLTLTQESVDGDRDGTFQSITTIGADTESAS